MNAKKVHVAEATTTEAEIATEDAARDPVPAEVEVDIAEDTEAETDTDTGEEEKEPLRIPGQDLNSHFLYISV
jgi:hypothetical protein